MPRKNDPAGAGGTEVQPSKPQPSGGSNGSVPAGSGPPGPAPQGQEWQWKPDPSNPQKGWWVLAAAVIGGIAANQQARAANRSSSSQTHQNTTQTPYQDQLIQSDIEAILNLQRNLINQGPAQIGGPRAQVARQAQPGSAPPPIQSGIGRDPRGSPVPGAHPAAPTAGVPTDSSKSFGGRSMAELAADPRLVNKLSPADLKAYNRAKKGGGGGGASAGGAAGPGTNFNDPNSIAAAVAREGLLAGSDPTTLAAEAATRNILSGQGGADSGGTGFQGYNPINDALAQRLLGESTDADELLRQFLGAAGTVGGGGGPGGGGSGGGRGAMIRVSPSGTSAAKAAIAASGGGMAGGVVPDAAGTGLFGTKVRELLDSGASDADVQAIIDAQNADINRGLQTALWDLDAASQGAGRLGGDTWAGLQNQARHDAVGQMGTFASKTRLGELADRRGMFQNLLGQVNARDIAAMQDKTAREGIAAGERSAGAAAGAGAASAERAQNLQAIGMLLQNQQNNLSELSGLGGRLSTDQLSAIGLAPDLAGVNLSGLGAANQAAGVQSGLRQAQMQAGVARAGLNQQAQMFNAQQGQQLVNDYLRTIMGIGSMGGSSTTQGTNVQPGLGISPTGAALQGALGAGLAAYGAGR